MIGVTWKGSGLVSDSRSAIQSIGFGPEELFSGHPLALQTRAGFYLYFSYASAFGRWPAPGVGSPA
jgi:hypothetical protein